MAMKVKPNVTSEPPIRLMTGDLVSVMNSDELTSVGNAVRAVLYGSKSKIKPSDSKRKRKKLVAKQHVKDMESCSKKKTKPVFPSKPTPTHNEHDDGRYAMWWDFKTDLSIGEYPNYKGMKIHPINASYKEKMLAEVKSRESKVSKSSIKNLKALGVTPRAHAKAPKLCGNAPHPADKSGFAEVIAANKSYEKELISRYCSESALARDLPSIFGHLDHISTVTQIPTNASGTGSVNAELDTINKLEEIVMQDNKQRTVSAVTDKVMRHNDRLHRAEAKLFDMELGEYLQERFPSAANDDKFKPSDLLVSETRYEQEQWTTPEDRMNMMAAPGAVISSDEIAYCYALRNAEDVSTIEYNQPIGIHDEGAWLTAEGFRYLNWLRYHDSRWLREKQESIRVQACQAYTMNVGVEVHPLWHTGEAVTAKHISALNRSRIRAFDDGLMDNMTPGTWYWAMPHIIAIKKEKAEKAEALLKNITEQIDNEELADKIVNETMSMQDEVIVSYGSDFVEEEDEVSTTASEHSPTPVGAEIVELAAFRNDRALDIAGITPKLKPLFAGLTKEQAEGARIVIEALTKALG